MNISKNSARSTLFQIVVFLVVVAVLLFIFKDNVGALYSSGDINLTGVVLNGVIILLFLLGMFRMVITLLRYVNEHQTLQRLVGYLQEDVSDPVARLSSEALAVQRYQAVR